MSAHHSGDTRLLCWGLYLESPSTPERVRYLLFIDSANDRFQIIDNDGHNFKSNTYDFWTIASSEVSEKDNCLVILQLDNTKQSYSVTLFLESTLDRDCVYQLLNAARNANISPMAARLGWTAELEIGVQAQRIQPRHSGRKQSSTRSPWMPRILSVVHNRILLFRDKSNDFHPTELLSLSTPSFAVYRAEMYEHTIQVHSTKDVVYQFHCCDDMAVDSLLEHIRSALTKYNPNALVL